MDRVTDREKDAVAWDTPITKGEVYSLMQDLRGQLINLVYFAEAATLDQPRATKFLDQFVKSDEDLQAKLDAMVRGFGDE